MTPRKPKPPAEQSWDEFWSEVTAKAETTVIAGVTVRVPKEITLGFEKKLTDLSESGSLDDIRDLVRDLFGADAYDQWVANGMTETGFQAAMGWGLARAKGKELTFREAYELVVEREKNPPQAANRASRRAASKSPSASTGATSRPTSARTTASRQRKSPA